MKQETAVQWLVEQLPIIQQEGLRYVIEDAIHMEKQQIIDAYWEGGENMAKKYFAETYGSKGSDKKKINLVEIPQEQLEEERNTNYKYFNIDDTSSQTEISDESWEGCDGCTEQDKYFWTKGYQAGYNRATPTEISDDRTKLHWKTSLVIHTPKEISDDEMWEKANEMGKKTNSSIVTQYFYYGAKWYREQLKQKQ